MFECPTCEDAFYYRGDLEEHVDDYNHWADCETCDRGFLSQHACNQHMNDKDHWAPRYECEMCTKEFLSQHAANRHMTAAGHWEPKIGCETCTKKFHTQGEANKHMNARGHYKHYCESCCIRFENANNLKMHLNSKIHRGQNIPCPFCKVKFTTASGVSHHLETGSCPNAGNLNHQNIHRMIRERDVHGVITNKLIEWKEESFSQYSATDRAFNGYNWECYICHKEFNAKFSLNNHLNSPVHRQKVYHCPNAKAKCGKDFVSLAALFNHLESESCVFMRFEKVQKHAADLFTGRKLIAF